MDLKEEIEEYIKNQKFGISLEQLIKKFKIERKKSGLLADALLKLQLEGKIILDDNNNYSKVPEDFYLKSGVVKISNRGNYYINMGRGKRINIKKQKGQKIKKDDFVYVKLLEKQDSNPKKKTGIVVKKVESHIQPIEYKYLTKATVEIESSSRLLFVIIDNKKIYLSRENSACFYPNDVVTVLVDYRLNTAEVKEVIERNTEEHVFKCIIKDNKKKWIPIGTYPFEIDSKISDMYKSGDQVIAKIITKKDEKPDIEIVNKLVIKNECPQDIESIIYEHGFNIGFSSEVKNEIGKLNKKITSNDIIERCDLRNLETFTIDPETAKDLDDAVSLEKEGDNYILYVHIADVSHYVRPKTAMFREAIKKGTSIYLPNYTEPMLSTELSNELCSLNPNEDKLTKTSIIKLDAQGNVLDYKIVRSIIRSNYKMSYNKVNDIIEGIHIDEDYFPYYNTLMEMNNLSNILQNRRIANGSLIFETNELVFETDEFGNVISLNNKDRGPAQIMIENFMVIQNQLTAEYAYWLNHPFIYRNHLAPTVSKSLILEQTLRKSNILRKVNNIQNAKNLQSIMSKIMDNKTDEEKKHLSSIFLRTLNRAYFDNENVGHYALALSHYSMVTSPIRRGCDLINHLMLDNILKYNLNDNDLDDIIKNIKGICSHLTKREYEEEQVEKSVETIMLQRYIKKFANTKLNAHITFITPNSIYLKTENNIFGYVYNNKRIIYLRDKNAFYNPKLNELYQIGSSIDVILMPNNDVQNSINFELIGLAEEKVLIKKENNNDKYKRR